jgi:PAS domain S-box-containing protein
MSFLYPLLTQLPGSGDFSPHGFCYLWNRQLMWLHVVSDIAIAVAYFTIPFTLLWFIRKRRDIPFSWIFGLFALFIVACGVTHLMEVWNIWHTAYWLEGVLKAITALASISTAIVLARSVPALVQLPSPEAWRLANIALEAEINQHRETENRVREQEARYRDIAELVELTHDAIFVRDLASKIVYWNSAAERLYGWTNEEAIGATTHQLLKTVFPEPLEEIEADLLRHGSWEGELTHTCRNGEVRTVSSRWALRRDVNGEPVSMLESNRDVTARSNEDKKFRGLLESAPDPMVIVDGEGVIRLVNVRTQTVFGYSREELIGHPVEIIVPERFREGHVVRRSRYAQCPVTRAMGADLELYGRRKDGSEFPVEISLSPLETRGGTLISSAIRDVSERIRIQKDLRDANEFLEQRVQSRTEELATANAGLIKSQESIALAQRVARVGTFEFDGSTGRASWTPGLEAIYGLERGSFSGTVEAWLSMVHPEDREHAKRHLEIAIETHSPYSNQYRILRADGEIRWIRAQGQLFFGQQGEFRRLVGANLDITDSKNKENEIVALNTTLERRVEERTRELSFANKELESFSYSVSHDLRAPLRHIDGFARILSEEYAAELPEDGRSYLARILKSTTDMGKLIDSLIKLAHLGRRELSCEKVNLGELVKSVIADLPQTDASRNVEWRIETLPKVNCDPDLLRIVLTNLLSNALKFTRTRAAAVIEVGTAAKNGDLAYFVKDNGVGFDPNYADKLFGVFQRLHAQEKFEGTGIGLATVQRIIHRHGGRIWAESALDQGATFFFTFGVARGESASVERMDDALRNQEPVLTPAAKR